MNNTPELPDDAIAAIHARRKIEAIKLLRERFGVGLKEAKEMVDDYVASQPAEPANHSPQTESGIGRLILLCIVAALIYVGYQYAFSP
jgi:hypothetical protein